MTTPRHTRLSLSLDLGLNATVPSRQSASSRRCAGGSASADDKSMAICWPRALKPLSRKRSASLLAHASVAGLQHGDLLLVVRSCRAPQASNRSVGELGGWLRACRADMMAATSQGMTKEM